jgi:hypothetical protein
MGISVYMRELYRAQKKEAAAREKAEQIFKAALDDTTELAKALKQTQEKYDGLVPDQAAVMTHVGYHFTNLWFAVEQENWPLADFYLGEARNNIKWAVRSKPFRKGPTGEQIDLNAIATALDNTQLAGLKKLIDAKQKAPFAALYEETLSQCYGCHKTSGKPYLRPHVPASPEVRIINMDPKATKPE